MTSVVDVVPNNHEIFDKVPNFQLIRGEKRPLWLKRDVIEKIFDFMPQDGDILIASYPKTGTTWMSYIVHQLLTKGESFPSFDEMLLKAIPYVEASGIEAVECKTERPRVYKHHLPYNVLKKNPNTKIIYIYRKPEDTFVSFYHFMNGVYKHTNIDFDQYFEEFLTGNVGFGHYLEHIVSYLECKDDGNILFVSYEKLQAQTKEEILKVAKFLDAELYDVFVNDEKLMNAVIEKTSFKFMKSKLALILPADLKEKANSDSKVDEVPKREVSFFRKGVIGEGKQCLTEDQLFRLRELVKKAMKGTDILKEWIPEEADYKNEWRNND